MAFIMSVAIAVPDLIFPMVSSTAVIPVFAFEAVYTIF
jgi:hypothetical protein